MKKIIVQSLSNILCRYTISYKCFKSYLIVSYIFSVMLYKHLILRSWLQSFRYYKLILVSNLSVTMKSLLLIAVVLILHQNTEAFICPEHENTVETYPNPEDCGSYYECVGDQPYLMHCAIGLQWAEALKQCDWPDVANCHISSSPEPPTTTTTTASAPTTPYPTKCPEIDSPTDILLPNPIDCGSFFKCFHGIPHLIECPPGQQWADKLKRCDWPEVAHCTVSTTSRISTTYTTLYPTKCPAIDGPVDVLLPNPKDCGSFFKCSGGVPYLIKCPPGQEWADALKRCDWPDVAHCHTTEEVLQN